MGVEYDMISDSAREGYELGKDPWGDKDAARQALSAAAASPTSFPGQDEARKALAGLK